MINKLNDYCYCLADDLIETELTENRGWTTSNKSALAPLCGHGIHISCARELLSAYPNSPCPKCRRFEWLKLTDIPKPTLIEQARNILETHSGKILYILPFPIIMLGKGLQSTSNEKIRELAKRVVYAFGLGSFVGVVIAISSIPFIEIFFDYKERNRETIHGIDRGAFQKIITDGFIVGGSSALLINVINYAGYTTGSLLGITALVILEAYGRKFNELRLNEARARYFATISAVCASKFHPFIGMAAGALPMITKRVYQAIA